MPERRTRGAPEIGQVERMVALRNLPGAADLHASDLSVLATVARPRRLRAGEVLTHEGTVMHAVAIVLRGRLHARRGGRALAPGHPGSVVGLLETLARDPRGLECVAHEDTTLLQITAEDLEDVFEELPAFLVRLATHLAERLVETHPLRPRAPSRAPTEHRSFDRPLDRVERILQLRACPALAHATIDAVTALADVARETRSPDGASVWRRGSPADALFVIVSGELDLARSASARTTLHPGDLAGDAEAIAALPHATDATARGALVALAIDREALFDTWEDHVDLGVELLREASTWLLSENEP